MSYKQGRQFVHPLNPVSQYREYTKRTFLANMIARSKLKFLLHLHLETVAYPSQDTEKTVVFSCRELFKNNAEVTSFDRQLGN